MLLVSFVVTKLESSRIQVVSTPPVLASDKHVCDSDFVLFERQVFSLVLAFGVGSENLDLEETSHPCLVKANVVVFSIA